MKNKIKFELYFLSLWLLFLMIFILTIDIPIYFGEDYHFIGLVNLLKRNKISFVCVILMLFCVIILVRFNFKVNGNSEIPCKILKIEDVSYEHLVFLATYIIPLVCLNLTNERYIIVLTFLLIVIGFIYIKTNMYYANPTLAMVGYKLYKIEFIDRIGVLKTVIIITKDDLSQNDFVSLLKLDEKTYFARKVDEHN